MKRSFLYIFLKKRKKEYNIDGYLSNLISKNMENKEEILEYRNGDVYSKKHEVDSGTPEEGYYEAKRLQELKDRQRNEQRHAAEIAKRNEEKIKERLADMIDYCDNGTEGLDNGVNHFKKKIHSLLEELGNDQIFYGSLDEDLEKLLAQKMVSEKEIEALIKTRDDTRAVINENKEKLQKIEEEYSTFKYDDKERQDERKFESGLSKRKDEFFEILDKLRAQSISIKIHSEVFGLIRKVKEEERVREEERFNRLLEHEEKLYKKASALVGDYEGKVKKELTKDLDKFLEETEGMEETQKLYESICNLFYLYNSSNRIIQNEELEFRQKERERINNLKVDGRTHSEEELTKKDYTQEKRQKTVKRAKDYLSEEYLAKKEEFLNKFSNNWDKKIEKIIDKQQKLYKKEVETFAKELEKRMKELYKYIDKNESLSNYVKKHSQYWPVADFDEMEIKLIRGLCMSGYAGNSIPRAEYDNAMKTLRKVERGIKKEELRRKESNDATEENKRKKERKEYEEKLSEAIKQARHLLGYAKNLEGKPDSKEESGSYRKNLFDRARFLFKKPDYLESKAQLIRQINNEHLTVGQITEAIKNFEDAIKFRWG